VRSTQTKEAARRDAQTARKRRSRAADAAAAPADDAKAALHEQKKVASREADAARKRRSRAGDAAAAPADDAAARLDQNKVARREADAARRRRSRAADATATRSTVWGGLCVPLSSLQTTRRLHFTSRRKWRVVRLMLRAGVGPVKLMPLPRSDVCGVVCVRHDV